MIGKSYQVQMLSELLRQAEMQHQVISQNIANVNTPGYRALQVRFDQTLSEAENRSTPRVFRASGLTLRQDGNNVDVDRELGSLTKNSMNFETYTHLMASKLGMLRSAITGQ